jgi:hypothetical protein
VAKIIVLWARCSAHSGSDFGFARLVRRLLGALTNPMATRKKSSRKKYGKAASKKVAKVMRERKRGKLRSGRSGKKVTSRKQAIAIGLSEARSAGAKVPRKAGSSRRKTKKKRSAR